MSGETIFIAIFSLNFFASVSTSPTFDAQPNFKSGNWYALRISNASVCERKRRLSFLARERMLLALFLSASLNLNVPSWGC